MSKIKVIIKNLANREFPLYVYTTNTIKQGKELYSTDDPQWKFMAKVLSNDKTFQDYDIEDGDIIISNDRSEGGKMNKNKIL